MRLGINPKKEKNRRRAAYFFMMDWNLVGVLDAVTMPESNSCVYILFFNGRMEYPHNHFRLV
jgi:hypothetical protein